MPVPVGHSSLSSLSQASAHHGFPLQALAPSSLAGRAAAWPAEEALSQGGRRGTLRGRAPARATLPLASCSKRAWGGGEAQDAAEDPAFLCCFIFVRATVSWWNKKLPTHPVYANSEEARLELAASLALFMQSSHCASQGCWPGRGSKSAQKAVVGRALRCPWSFRAGRRYQKQTVAEKGFSGVLCRYLKKQN